jgi:hypothetical protein
MFDKLSVPESSGTGFSAGSRMANTSSRVLMKYRCPELESWEVAVLLDGDIFAKKLAARFLRAIVQRITDNMDGVIRITGFVDWAIAAAISLNWLSGTAYFFDDLLVALAFMLMSTLHRKVLFTSQLVSFVVPSLYALYVSRPTFGAMMTP